MKKRIAILGSTGSIGTQALEVIASHPETFELTAITARNNAELLIQQAFRFVPAHVVITNTSKYKEVKEALSSLPVQVHSGEEVLCSITGLKEIDIVLTALVGFAGLSPTISAIKAGKDIALANKETLVVAGEIIVESIRKYKSKILPVDSEHSAIFQCLAGEEHNRVEKIYLTASGGPFREYSASDLEKVTRAEALAHPNWCMGNKVTIDSATLMNKGLEAIEARWLFNLDPSQIDIIVHPQSIIHSLVQFEDGSIKAQMGLPDMRLPIQYALGYPNRLKSTFRRFDFLEYSQLTFEKPDTNRFPNLRIALAAMNKGGNMPCIMNAANEVAVSAFLCDRIPFLSMSGIIENVMGKMEFVAHPEINDYFRIDKCAREMAESLITR